MSGNKNKRNPTSRLNVIVLSRVYLIFLLTFRTLILASAFPSPKSIHSIEAEDRNKKGNKKFWEE
jgi:hypothetical protein